MQAAEQYFVEFKQVTQHPRSLITQVLNLACIVLSALMMWKGLMVCTQSESPVVVVLSGSMEPGFYRGDILGLTLFDDPLRNADIVVFQIEGRDVPIVHRYVLVLLIFISGLPSPPFLRGSARKCELLQEL